MCFQSPSKKISLYKRNSAPQTPSPYSRLCLPPGTAGARDGLSLAHTAQVGAVGAGECRWAQVSTGQFSSEALPEGGTDLCAG